MTLTYTIWKPIRAELEQFSRGLLPQIKNISYLHDMGDNFICAYDQSQESSSSLLVGILLSKPNFLKHELLVSYDTYISHIFVLPAYQKQGIWKKLLDTLSTTTDNQSFVLNAIYNSWWFYKKQWFEYIGNFEDHIYYWKKSDI